MNCILISWTMDKAGEKERERVTNCSSEEDCQ